MNRNCYRNRAPLQRWAIERPIALFSSPVGPGKSGPQLLSMLQTKNKLAHACGRSHPPRRLSLAARMLAIKLARAFGRLGRHPAVACLGQQAAVEGQGNPTKAI